jgi:hypothetical protein
MIMIISTREFFEAPSCAVCLHCFKLYQCGPAGGPRATSTPKTIETRPIKLFINSLPVTTSSFILFSLNGMKVMLLVYSAALHAGSTHAINFKILS